MNKIKDYLLNIVNGASMAVADSVPGVSGGTVAFILGFYDKFIASLDDLFRGSIEKKKEAFKYLIKIGIGWVIGLLLSILFLASLFDKFIYPMSSLFIGFVCFAIPIVIKDEKDNLKGKYHNLIFLIFGLLLVIVITYLNRQTGSLFNVDKFTFSSALYVFIGASLAISAMILPGISGSTMLLIFGLYIPIVTKVKAFLHLDFSVFPILLVFGLGMIFGIVVFSKLLRASLTKKRSAIFYVIVGMMLGSIYSIMMGPTTLDVPKEMLNFSTFNLLFFLLGGIIMFALEFLKRYLSKISQK